MKREEIEKLAKLSRLELRSDEIDSFAKDFDSILNYVGEINEVVVKESEKEAGELNNVMREDGEPHKSGLNTEALLDEAPAVDKNFVKVKSVFE